MDAEQHATVEERHTQAAREIAERYLRDCHGVFASAMLAWPGTVGLIKLMAQALADEFEAGRQDAIDNIGEVLENCTPRRANQ